MVDIRISVETATMIEDILDSVFPRELSDEVEADIRMDMVMNAAFDTREKRVEIIRRLIE